MKKIVIAEIVIQINISGKSHCSNNCDYLDIVKLFSPLEYNARCVLFDTKLKWDNKLKSNGYKRCAACQRAKIKHGKEKD